MVQLIVLLTLEIFCKKMDTVIVKEDAEVGLKTTKTQINTPYTLDQINQEYKKQRP